MRENPPTFYAWLLRVSACKLKVGPLQAFNECRYQHAVSRTNGYLVFGFWDHQSNTGYLDPENPTPREGAPETPGKKWDVLKA